MKTPQKVSHNTLLSVLGELCSNIPYFLLSLCVLAETRKETPKKMKNILTSIEKIKILCKKEKK
jgi:hypothetical protein